MGDDQAKRERRERLGSTGLAGRSIIDYTSNVHPTGTRALSGKAPCVLYRIISSIDLRGGLDGDSGHAGQQNGAAIVDGLTIKQRGARHGDHADLREGNTKGAQSTCASSRHRLVP